MPKSNDRRRSQSGKVQPRARVTRNAVLEAALREFAQQGLAGARVDRIASRAGVNKQALYYHYGNKEDLFQATLASIYEQSVEIPKILTSRELSPTLAMRGLITALFDGFRRIEDGTAVITHENHYHGKHLTQPLRRQIRTSVAPIIEAINEILCRGQNEGVFNQEISGEDLYLSLIALSMFYFAHAYTLSAILDRDLLSDEAVAAWKFHVEEFVIAALRSGELKQKSTI